MRVIAGTARGRRIIAPAGHNVRPTLDRVRQATFNALVHRDVVADRQVLDLFAGSGALGIEALSRGATHVTFVENDREALRCIETNLAILGFGRQATVVRSDASRWLAANRGSFDLVFADPPYSFDGWVALLGAIHSTLSGAGDGLAVLETPDVLELGIGWDVVRQQRYGGTVVTLAAPSIPD